MSRKMADTVFRRSANIYLPKIFHNGLGNPKLLERLVDNFEYFRDPEFITNFLVQQYGRQHPIQIDKRDDSNKKWLKFDGSFQSPFNELLPGSMPAETRTAHFSMLVPRSSAAKVAASAASVQPDRPTPMVLHLSGTGDNSVTLQRWHAERLTELGIGSLLLVNPFYKPSRRPKDQKGSSLSHMSDLFVMGGSLILECWLLLRWLEACGYGPLALHGVSMGGYMASLAASVYNRPVALVPCLSWTTSSSCYMRGALASSLDRKLIQSQLAKDVAFRERIWPKIRDRSCPLRYQVPATFADPLRATGNGGNSYANVISGVTSRLPGSLESLRSMSDRWLQENKVIKFANGLFADGSSQLTGLKSMLGFETQANLMETNFLRQQEQEQQNKPKMTAEEEEMQEFVTCLLDYFTHMGNYEPPIGPIYSVQALNDAYILRDGVFPLTELWPGMTCRVVPGGHVGTIIFNCAFSKKDFRDIVLASLGLENLVNATKSAGSN